MAKYRQVHTSFWQDPFVIDLTPEDKYFFLYLMTNSKTTQCGIYELSISTIAFETGYNFETVKKLLKKFIGYGKIEYCEKTKEIFIINWLKYNFINSPSVISCISKELESVKNKEFLHGIDTLCKRYGYPIHSLCIDSGEEEEEKKKNKNKKPSSEKKESTPYQQIIDLYNQICVSLPRVTKITDFLKEKIKARMNDLPTLEDWKAFFEKVEASDYLTYRNKVWSKCNFRWLVKNQENLCKVLEGNYDNDKENNPSVVMADTKQRGWN